MSTTLVLPLAYWPSVDWVRQWYNSSSVLVEQWATYQKQSHFNRCRIVGVNGPLTLSVPLAGGREQRAFEQAILIDHTQRWAVQHLRTLQSCYAKAPFFDYYYPAVQAILLAPQPVMMDVNKAILHKLIQWLRWQGKLTYTSSFQHTKPATKDFDTGLPPYVQVFSDRQPFLPNLSILDALFCLGPHVSHYLSI
jgi:hypothetical protein